MDRRKGNKELKDEGLEQRGEKSNIKVVGGYSKALYVLRSSSGIGPYLRFPTAQYFYHN